MVAVMVLIVFIGFLVVMIVVTVDHMRRNVMMKDTRNNLNTDYAT